MSGLNERFRKTFCLNDYYNLKCKELGYRSMNHIYAELQVPAIENLKKRWKQEFKTLKGEQNEISNTK